MPPRSSTNARIENAGLAGRARILCKDYRDIDRAERFDKIVSLEMVEHVGVKNLLPFYFEEIVAAIRRCR